MYFYEMNDKIYIFLSLSDHMVSMTIDIYLYFIFYVNKVMGLTGGITNTESSKEKKEKKTTFVLVTTIMFDTSRD